MPEIAPQAQPPVADFAVQRTPPTEAVPAHQANISPAISQEKRVAPAQPKPVEPTPKPKLDRAQQERFGQMAAHNPDMVKVPKHMSDTQVWNGLSRINEFHTARDHDDDPRSPWERKVVEKKPERPKKLLRKTAIEEVGRPKKVKQNQSMQRDVTEPTKPVEQQSPTSVASHDQTSHLPATPAIEPIGESASRSAELDSGSEVSRIEQTQPSENGLDRVSRERDVEFLNDSTPQGDVAPKVEAGPISNAVSRMESPTPISTSSLTNSIENHDSTPSLEEVWPVQRLDETSSMLNDDGGESLNLDPPSRPVINRQEQAQSADVQAAISRVESAQQSDSSIDFVPPTRPRPQILRKPKPQVEPTESFDVPSPQMSTEAETSQSPIPIQREPYGVQTEVGELPSDLWNLVGDQPPAQTQTPIAQRVEDEAQGTSDESNTGSDQAHQSNQFPSSEAINRFEGQPEPLASPQIQPIEPSDPSDHQVADQISREFDQPQVRLTQPPPSAPALNRVERESASVTNSSNVDAETPFLSAPVQRKEVNQSARLSSWDFIDAGPEAVNRRNDVADQNGERPTVSQSMGGSDALFNPAATLAPATFRPVMRAEADAFEQDLDDSSADFDEPSPEADLVEAPADPLADLVGGQEPKGTMVYADSEAAEESGNASVPVEVSTPQLEQPATLFADGEELVQVAAQAEPKAAAESVLLFADEGQAADKFETPMPVSVIPEDDGGDPAQAFGDEAQVSALTADGESGEKEAGLTLYPDDDGVSGSVVELKIKIDGEDELLIGFADSNQLSQFIDVAAAADQTPGLMLFPSEGGDGEQDFDPVPFLLQRQGEQELVIGFADEATLDAFLSEATEVERGPTALIYAEQEAADEDLENPAEVHFRLAEGNDVLLGYADAEALEELIQAAEEVSPEQDLNELTQLVYGRLRQQLLIENERRGVRS